MNVTSVRRRRLEDIGIMTPSVTLQLHKACSMLRSIVSRFVYQMYQSSPSVETCQDRRFFLNTNHGPVVTQVDAMGFHLLWNKSNMVWEPMQFVNGSNQSMKLCNDDVVVGIASWWNNEHLCVDTGAEKPLVYSPVPKNVPPGTMWSPDIKENA